MPLAEEEQAGACDSATVESGKVMADAASAVAAFVAGRAVRSHQHELHALIICAASLAAPKNVIPEKNEKNAAQRG